MKFADHKLLEFLDLWFFDLQNTYLTCLFECRETYERDLSWTTGKYERSFIVLPDDIFWLEVGTWILYLEIRQGK